MHCLHMILLAYLQCSSVQKYSAIFLTWIGQNMGFSVVVLEILYLMVLWVRSGSSSRDERREGGV